MGDNNNIILVGEKAFMCYVTGVVLQFTSLGSQDVVIKARGKFIAKAVDIAEVARKRFLENKIFVEKILIDSEDFKNKEGKQIRVSSIEIYMSKQ